MCKLPSPALNTVGAQNVHVFLPSHSYTSNTLALNPFILIQILITQKTQVENNV